MSIGFTLPNATYLLQKTILNSEEIRIPPILYHSQQCAEKSLKAFLIYRGHNILRVHDLVLLTNLCIKIDPSFEALMPDALELNPYITKGRYPSFKYILPVVSEAEYSVKAAQKFYDFVIEKIR